MRSFGLTCMTRFLHTVVTPQNDTVHAASGFISSLKFSSVLWRFTRFLEASRQFKSHIAFLGHSGLAPRD